MSKKNEKLDKLLKSLEKNYIVHKAKDFKEDPKIRTEIFGLDYVLSGGIHQCLGGHRIEFFGAESTGKSTFALKVIAQYQKLGKVCVYMDGEHSYDPDWAEICGIDNDNLLIVNPNNLQEAGDLYVKLIPEADLIVTDSIVSLIPEEEIERDTNEPTMALQARINSLITRKIYKTISNRKTTMIFINQLREKVGQLYGNPYTTGGGRALKHMYNTRIEFRNGKPIDIGSGDKKERIGYEINMKAIKNKKGTPYKKAVVDFYFTGNIDNCKSLFFAGIKYGVVELSGKTYTFKDKKAVGKDNFIKELTDKDYKKIEEELWKRMK